MKRCQESEPALISVIFSFVLRLSEVKYIVPLVEKRERRENCQSIMFDEERFKSRWSRAVIYRMTSCPHLKSEESRMCVLLMF